MEQNKCEFQHRRKGQCSTFTERNALPENGEHLGENAAENDCDDDNHQEDDIVCALNMQLLIRLVRRGSQP